MSDSKKAWYAISVTGGKEIKIRDWIIANKKKFDISDDIMDQVVLPIQKKIYVKDGKKRVVESSLMGPYIYIHADVSNEKLINFFIQAPNVYSFVGSGKRGFRDSGDVIRDEDMRKILGTECVDANEDVMDLKIGDSVEIISGSFASFKGNIVDINTKTNVIKVNIIIFGGENIIEVQSSQIKKQ